MPQTVSAAATSSRSRRAPPPSQIFAASVASIFVHCIRETFCILRGCLRLWPLLRLFLLHFGMFEHHAINLRTIHAGTNYGPYNGPPMSNEPVFSSYEEGYRYMHPGEPVPSNGKFTNEPGGCYIWEPKPGSMDPITMNNGQPIIINYC